MNDTRAWLWYAKPDSLLSKTEFNEKSVALVLCFRDWYERLDDAAAELALSRAALTRLYDSCLWAYESAFNYKEKYPFNTQVLSNDELRSVRGIGSCGIEVIRKADGYPKEPMTCLTDSERKHIEEYAPWLSFDAVEINTRIFFTA